MAQVYLRMFRVDKALEEWTLMKEIDEDSTLTQLALGFLDLAQVRTSALPRTAVSLPFRLAPHTAKPRDPAALSNKLPAV
jgi:hypothetical protein